MYFRLTTPLVAIRDAATIAGCNCFFSEVHYFGADPHRFDRKSQPLGFLCIELYFRKLTLTGRERIGTTAILNLWIF